MKLLVLGGTGFLGPQIVQAALARKHTVTLFNRGKTNAELFPETEKLQGDRNGDLASLAGKKWDAVIDVPATLPRWVKLSADALKDACKQYLFISTVSVYDDYSKPVDESAHTFDVDPKLDDIKRITNENMNLYGSLKRRCEAIVSETFGERGAVIVRPGLIVGPDDPSDRFTYWPVRVDRGGTVLAPGNGKDGVQFVDAHDLGAFVVKLLEDGHAGTYNATGPASDLSMAEFLYGCRAATSSEVKFEWVDTQFLLEQGVQPFSEIPMWIPGADHEHFMRIDCSKAKSVGLNFRPLGLTAKATTVWAGTRPKDYRWQAGLSAEREAAILEAWKNRPQK